MTETPIWTPTTERISASVVEDFRRQLDVCKGVEVADSTDLHRFSCDHPGQFWRELWEFAGVVGEPGSIDVDAPSFATTQFFPEGRVDVAATMLRGALDDVVVIECDESGTTERVTRGELRRRVASMAAMLRSVGVVEGDVVAAYSTTSLPTLTMMLAAAACGAVYTTTSAEFGTDSVIDRLSQVRPRVLLAVPGYTFAGRSYDVRARVAEIVDALDSIELVVLVSTPDDEVISNAVRPRWTTYAEATAADTELRTTAVPFNAPGWILYSSGTTGKPKCIVHRAGGVLLKHLSEMLLHCDIRRGDRVFYYTTPSWMMWNWLVSGLAAGACIVLYNGSPLAPDERQLLTMAAREGVTYFGTSPSYLDAVRRSDVQVVADFELPELRTVAVTGAPLSPSTAAYAATWGDDIHVLSKSGGTDLCGGLVTGDPTTPVWGGEIQAPAFGCRIAIVDEAGNDVARGVTGELVSRTAFPSMPIQFVDDADGSRLHDAYYHRFPGCWHQADFVSRTRHGGYVVHGRSDTTLNANGVRIGTAEIYSQLERIRWITAAVALEHRAGDRSQVVLLLEVDAGTTLGDAERQEIRNLLRERCSPRHVPQVIIAVAELPRTMNGKLSEVAAADEVNLRTNRAANALSNPHVLAELRVVGSQLADA